MTRTRTTALLSLIFTWVFFFEHRPPFRRVHIPYVPDRLAPFAAHNATRYGPVPPRKVPCPHQSHRLFPLETGVRQDRSRPVETLDAATTRSALLLNDNGWPE